MASIFGTFNLPVPEAEKVNLYPLTKELDTSVAGATMPSDDSKLSTITNPVQGDIAVIDSYIDGEHTDKTAYMWDGERWVALNGKVDADKVILTSNITMAGNYTQVGNLTKTQTGTATFETKGLSVADALNQIFSKKLQPSITANPSVGTVTISQSGAVEAGTVVDSVTVSAATFSAGSYTYGPATGVAVSSWETTRKSNKSDVALADVADGGAATDNGPFTIGDQDGDYSELFYRVTATYGDGVLAHDNLGGECTNDTQIKGSSTHTDSAKITPFRKYFYGATVARPAEINSAYIRDSLTHSSGVCSNGKTLTINVPEGATTVVIAYPATFRDLTSVIDTGAMNDNIVGLFTPNKKTIKVEGANGYTGIDYKVYSYTPDVALGANTYNVTI